MKTTTAKSIKEFYKEHPGARIKTAITKCEIAGLKLVRGPHLVITYWESK